MIYLLIALFLLYFFRGRLGAH